MLGKVIFWLVTIYFKFMERVLFYRMKKEHYKMTRERENWQEDKKLTKKGQQILDLLTDFYEIKRMKLPRIYFTLRDHNHYSPGFNVIVIGCDRTLRDYLDFPYDVWMMGEEISHFIRSRFAENDENVQEFFGYLGRRIVVEYMRDQIWLPELEKWRVGIRSLEEIVQDTERRVEIEDKLFSEQIVGLLPQNSELIQAAREHILSRTKKRTENHLNGYVAGELISWDEIIRLKSRLMKMSNEGIRELTLKIMTDHDRNS